MKRLWFVLLLGTLVFLCSCASTSSQGDDSAVGTVGETQIPIDTMHSISSDLESVAIDEVKVIALDDNGKIKISVYLDPAVTKYSFALNMEPILARLREDLSLHEIELSEYKMSAFFYKNGEVDSAMSWTSTDLDSGHFVSPMDGVSVDLTVSEVYAQCGYAEGEYESISGS